MSTENKLGSWSGATLPGYGGNVMVWVRAASDGPDGTIAMIGARSLEGDNAGSEADAYLDRTRVREAIAALQKALDDAGPEPIVEPEGIAYVIDSDGDTWTRETDGEYTLGKGTEGECGGYTFEYIVQTYGPVTPFRAEALPQVSA